MITAKDVRKIAEASFIVLKKQDHPTPSVWYKSQTSPVNWHKRPEEFKSKAARDRFVAKMLASKNVIELF